jgi:hypothetical protein
MSNQPKVAVALETVSLRLRAQLGRSVERDAKYVVSSTDRTYVASQAIEIALRQHAEPQKTPQPRPARAHGPSAPRRARCADTRAERPRSRRGETRPAGVVPSCACTHARLLRPPGGPPPLTHS